MDNVNQDQDREIHPVSAYARGQARLFLTRMTQDIAAWVGPLNKLRKDAIATLRRRNGKPPRPEMLVDLERAWRKLPTTGQLCPLVVTRERHRFEIIDLRAIPERLRENDENWDTHENEPALMLGAYSLTITRDQAIMDNTVVASVCLHSLGRRYERAADVSDAAFITDMGALAHYAGRNIDQPDGPFSAPIADGCAWLGKCSGFVTSEGRRYATVHHARTFVLR